MGRQKRHKHWKYKKQSMEADLILADTNIIIEILKNNKEIVTKIKAIGIEKIAVSCITVR